MNNDALIRELEKRLDKLQAERDAAMATLRRRREVPETCEVGESGNCFRCLKPLGGIMTDEGLERGRFCASCGAKVLDKATYRTRHGIRNRPSRLSF